MHWALIAAVESSLLVKRDTVLKFRVVALMLQLLTTVAVADVEVLAVRLPAGHELPLLLRHRMNGLAVKVAEYEPAATVCCEPKSRA